MSKDEDWCPLKGVVPAHTEIDVWEAAAKLTIEMIQPGQYSDLEFKDKPDLQSKCTDTGIEVTSSVSKVEEEMESLYARLPNRTHEQQVRDLERIEQLKGQVQSISISDTESIDVLIPPKGVDSFDRILEAHRIKLEKLNHGGYVHFSHYRLYIRSNILSDREMQEQALESLALDASQYEKAYEYVYVSAPQHMYWFDLERRKCGDTPISSTQETQCLYGSRALVYACERKRMLDE
jgi:hypothetical protein